jgi:hypothetical protein
MTAFDGLRTSEDPGIAPERPRLWRRGEWLLTGIGVVIAWAVIVFGLVL